MVDFYRGMPRPYEGPLEEAPPLPFDRAMVNIGDAPMDMMEEGARIQEIPGGGVVVDFEPEETAAPASEEAQAHDANLAEHVDENELGRIAQQVKEWVEADIESRSEWHQRLADGLTVLGVIAEKSDSTGVFKQALKINHPAIAEAAVQFQARASSELLPPGGPAKGQVLGEKTEELEAQATRVADYLNYQLMTEDGDFFPEEEKLLFTLSVNGSQFKKIHRDWLAGRNVTRWVRGEDFIVPYGATSLETAPRYTHQNPIERNDMKKLQAMGFYRDTALVTPVEGPTRDQRVAEQKDKAQGQHDAGDLLLDDTPHTAWECYCTLDLKGFEDKDEAGELTGISLPYVVTVDKDSVKVLSIRRNWKESDPHKRKLVNFVHKPFIPGDGFYSYGYLHFLGGAAQAATGLLRVILLGGAFASMNGGFKSKDAKLSSNVEIEYGVWKDTDLSAEELSKAFYTPQFREPSEALFKVLGLIQELVQRFSSTSESMVGDASNAGPVGTTVALIEQGSKVFSGIHKRLHFAQAQELKLLMELNGQHVPEEGYPYNVAGASREVFAADFDERVDVVPVSDPNIFSSTQRIAIAQTLVQRATEVPDLYDRRKVEKRFLEALRLPDPDDVLLDHSKIDRCDPVTENALLLVGRPVKAYQDQHHDAHIAVHQDQMNRLQAEQHPLLQQIGPAMMAHVAEHMAFSYRIKMAMMMGISLPPLDLSPNAEEAQPLPPEVENQIAQGAAAVIAQMPPPQGGQEQAALEEQAAAMQQEAEALSKQKQELEAMAQGIERQNQELAFGKREQGLRDKMAGMQQQARAKDQSAQVQSIVDAAVQRVEQALGKQQGAK